MEKHSHKPDSDSNKKACTTAGKSVEIVYHLQDIYRILHNLQQHQCHFTASLDEQNSLHSSLLLHIDADNDTLLFDHMAPAIASQQMHAAKTLHMQASYHGIGAWFSVDTSLVTNKKNGYLLPLPDKIYHQQRRSSYRIEFSMHERPLVEMYIDARQVTLRGCILDISVGGCAIQIPNHHGTLLTEGERGKILHLLIPNEFDLKAAVKLHNPVVQHKISSTRYGLEFIDLPAIDQKKIERFVARKQRESIRKLLEQETL